MRSGAFGAHASGGFRGRTVDPLAGGGAWPVTLEAVVTSAFDLNVAHDRLGTRLRSVDRGRVVLDIDWPAELFGPPGPAEWSHTVVTALLDHASGLAACSALAEPGLIGGTVSLRVDYLSLSEAGRPLVAVGTCDHVLDAVAHTRAVLFHPGLEGRPVARALTVMGIRRRPEP